MAGPIPDDCRLDHDLDPDVSEEIEDHMLYRWLGNEIANHWPFPAIPDSIHTSMGASS